MYKKVIIAFVLAFISLAGQADDRKVVDKTDGSITFVVDEGLKPIEERYRYLYDGERIAKAILSEDKTILNKEYNIVASSFADLGNLRLPAKDAFYQCVLEAYKKHKSLVLSPDMIWLLISQGFARYVNAHSEELRPMLVDHTGKMELAIEREQDLLSGEADYPKLVADFAAKIEEFTKDGIAATITSDFSTTGLAERVASQITLMESVKSYFEYLVMYISCGIPTITIKGTPADWQQVLTKTRRLSRYGHRSWTESLEPILVQFIRAAEGRPEQKFWQRIVKKERVEQFEGGGCSSKTPTRVDGWLLKLFPDENGQTLDSVFHTKEMPSERVYVGFKYRMLDGKGGRVLSETLMELMAGFIGAEEDTISNTLTPQIGWLLRKADKEEDLLADLRKKSEETINLKVKEVPEMLAQLEHINGLELSFTDDIVLPDWFSQLDINYLNLSGKLRKSEDLPQLLSRMERGCNLNVFYDKDQSISYLWLRGTAKKPGAQPQASAETPDIKDLSLIFHGSVRVPEWVSDYSIGELDIKGNLTKAEKRAISKRLRKANIGKLYFEKP